MQKLIKVLKENKNYGFALVIGILEVIGTWVICKKLDSFNREDMIITVFQWVLAFLFLGYLIREIYKLEKRNTEIEKQFTEQKILRELSIYKYDYINSLGKQPLQIEINSALKNYLQMNYKDLPYKEVERLISCVTLYRLQGLA